MPGSLRVLIVAASVDLAHRMMEALRLGGYDPTAERVASAEVAVEALRRADFDLVLSTYGSEDQQPGTALQLVRKNRPPLPIVVVSNVAGEEAAVEAMRAGASDYLREDNLARLVPAVERAIQCADRPTPSLEQVAKQKPVEVEHERSSSQLRLQIERMPLGYLLSGPDFCYTRLNPAAERLFGFTEAEALGRHPFDLIVPPQSQSLVQSVFDRLAGGDMEAHGSCENITKDGRLIVCEWHNTPLFGSNGEFEGVLSLAQDVTDRRRLEEQFRQAQKMEAIGRLAGGISHDFNNLLTIINGYSDLLLQIAPEGDPSREMLEEIHKAGSRSSSLTRQLLAFSRQQMLAPRLIDLNGVVGESEKMLRRLIGEDVRMTTALAADLGAIRADLGQLEQVILNLALNARDAMPMGGTLTIETRNVDLGEIEARTRFGVRSGAYVMLSVRDTGSGMKEEVKARIFEPFYTTKELGKGTGLGLAVVHGIVQQSGGHVEVDTAPGVGTEFRVYMPREGLPAPKEPMAPPARHSPRGAETILLVEDEEGVRALVRHILGGCGYTVLEATDAEDAIRVVARFARQIDLLLTDVVMPGIGGRELAKRLRSWHPGLRILFVSGYTDDAVVRHGIEEDEMNFLQKPFSPFLLAQKVRSVLDVPI